MASLNDFKTPEGYYVYHDKDLRSGPPRLTLDAVSAMLGQGRKIAAGAALTPTAYDYLKNYVPGAGGGGGAPEAAPNVSDIINGIASDPSLGSGRSSSSSGYSGAYRASLDQARANVEQMFGSALSEIAAREGSANQALDTLPGTLNDVYGQAQKSVDTNAQAMYQAQQKSGLTPLLPEGAEIQPIQAAISGAQASRLADVPLLRTGLSGAFSKERQGLEMQKAAALNDLLQQQAGYEAQQASSSQSGDDLSWLQKTLITHALDQQDQGKETIYGKFETSGDRGGSLVKNNGAVANAIRAGSGGRGSLAYMTTVSSLRSKPPKDQAGLVKLVNGLKAKYPNQADAISLALFDAGY